MAGSVLSQEELSSLLEDGAPGGKPKRAIVDYDLARPSRIGAERLRLLAKRHELLAARFAQQLLAPLRLPVAVELVGLTEQSFSAYRSGLAAASSCHLLGLAPLAERGLLVVDPGLTGAVLDRLLGGAGSAPAAPKALTALDRSLLEAPVRRLLDAWVASWKDLLPFTAVVEQLQTDPVELEGIPSAEPLLVASFRITAVDSFAGGGFALALPLVDLDPALAAIAAPPRFAPAKKAPTGEQRTQLGLTLGQGQLPVVVTLGTTTLTIGEVLALAPGDVLVLDQHPGDPGVATVAGRPRLLVKAGRVGNRLAVSVERTLPAERTGKEPHHG
jgi:flagellar motor switch protein FliM